MRTPTQFNTTWDRYVFLNYIRQRSAPVGVSETVKAITFLHQYWSNILWKDKTLAHCNF